MNNRELRESLDAYVEQGVVRKVQKGPLSLYNYTDKCTYERVWNPATLRARGLILDENDWIVANPFPKFFNLHEPDCPPVPDAPFQTQEKIDGSLGIWYFYDSRWRCATRGSFANIFTDYAESWGHLLQPFPKSWTILTEIVMPSTADGLRRAVSHTPGLYLLGARGRDSDLDYSFADIAHEWGGHHIERSSLLSLADIQTNATTLQHKEGWVLRFQDPQTTRIKIKTAWYVAVARSVNNLTIARVAELEREDPSGQWLQLFPEELRAEAETLRAQVLQIERNIAQPLLDQWWTGTKPDPETRKAISEVIAGFKNRSLIFLAIDNDRERMRKVILTNIKHGVTP